jgi:hypothetical protein
MRAILDGPDPDRDPDSVPIAGLSIVITSSLNPAVLRHAASGKTIVLDPIVLTTNANGVLVGPDLVEGIKLVPTDDLGTDHGWTYTATISGPTFARMTLTFDAPAGSTRDLGTLVPVPPAPGATLVAWQAAVNTVTTTRDEVVALKQSIESSATGPHTHAQGDVTGLQTALAGKQAAGSYASATHGHAQADVTGLTTTLSAKAPTESPTFTGTVSGVTKAHVGLGNVDNTSDANKPVSTAMQTALDGKAAAGSGGVSAATMATLVKTPVPWVTATAYEAGAFVTRADVIFRVDIAHTSSVAPTVANAAPTTPGANYSVWASPGNSPGSIPIRNQAGELTFKHLYMTDPPASGTSLINRTALEAAVANVEAPARPPTFGLVIAVGTDWTYRDVVITARPADLLPGERLFFIGSIPLPAWVSGSDIVTTG